MNTELVRIEADELAWLAARLNSRTADMQAMDPASQDFRDAVLCRMLSRRRSLPPCESCEQALLSRRAPRYTEYRNRTYDVICCRRRILRCCFFEAVRFRAAFVFEVAGVFAPVFLRSAFLAAVLFAAQRFRRASAIRCRPSSEIFDRFFAGRPGPRRCSAPALRPRSAVGDRSPTHRWSTAGTLGGKRAPS